MHFNELMYRESLSDKGKTIIWGASSFRYVLNLGNVTSQACGGRATTIPVSLRHRWERIRQQEVELEWIEWEEKVKQKMTHSHVV